MDATRPRLRIRQATPSDLDAAVDIHFAAFDDNVMNQLMYPGGVTADARAKFASHLFPQPASAATPEAEGNSTKGEAFLCVAEILPPDTPADAPGEIVAFAKWLLQRVPRTEDEWRADRSAAITESWGEGCNVAIVDAFIGRMTRIQQEHAQGEAALYLSILASSPTRQRTGAGSALLEWGNKLADSLGLPCRLEASPTGYGLYRKFGYEDIDVLDLKVTETWGKEHPDGANWGENSAVALAGPAPRGVMRTTADRATTMGQTDTHSRLAGLLASSRARARLLGTRCQLPSRRGDARSPKMDPVSAAANIIAIIHAANRGCRRVLAELENLLPPESILATDSKKKAILTALGWLLKEHKAKTLLDELREHKSTIALALTTDSSIEQLKADSKDTRANVQDIKADTNDIFAALTDVQEQHVYSWLYATDPSEIHDRSLDTCEPGTGEWLFRSPDWDSWLEEKTRCLWVHGIPGAGKTILASHLIERVKDHCWDRGAGDVCVYYYCHYSHTQDETAPFLRWVLLELCRRLGQVPQALYDLYRYGGKPTVRSLLRTLEQVIRQFDQVYIFVDAVDESLNRENLLRVLRDLATGPAFENIRLLATSREYADIEEVMTDISTPISMRNSFLDEDIALYVQSKLGSNSRLKRWPAQLREDVRKTLSAEANGMFRWVVCQIDAIQRLRPVNSIVKAALANLPKTLDETYERVFSRVPDEHRFFVQHVLHWMGTHRLIQQAIPNLERVMTCDFSRIDIPCGADIPLEVLFQAVERSLEAEGSSESASLSDYALDEELLRELCGCMVTVKPYEIRCFGRVVAEMPVVSFAHYTVLEFLESRRIRDGPAKAFALNREHVIVDHANVLLRGAAASADRWGSEMPLKPGEDFYADFDRYSAHSSLLLLHYQAGVLSSSAASSWLPAVLRLMEIPAPDFGSYFWYTPEVLINLEDPVSPAIQAFRRTHALKFRSPPVEAHLDMLVRLLRLDESGFLAQTYLASLGRGDDNLSSSVDIDIHPSAFNNQGGVVRFRGSVLELYAHVPPVSWVQQGHMRGLYKLIARAAGHFDPSKLLLFAIGCHQHTDRGPGQECWGCLVLTHLLCLGAKSKVPGYSLGALQMATALQDIAGVKLLLDAGVDPNEVGDPCGDIGTPEQGPLFESLGSLQGRTPLRILGDPYFRLRNLAFPETIAALLLEYGATSEPAVALELHSEVSITTGLEMVSLSGSGGDAGAQVGGC
ncbi:hypothetical protein C8A05DRAFT_41334 [Staphylotrichum tortipilum]|uniref:N-acetyltransferase domain-containing protein n=1 Tax=Staphylotrichum tortipilum TaxID=2831512 RepID=A0AAN6MU93_9PEZI|nr:hypothetical protein C8A05DRAFT_41334 [Staphylotrichum longicolle]